MSIQMTKTWFVDGKIIEEKIPESEIYARPWNIEKCKAYAVQLKDKKRANTAEHAAEAIEYLLQQTMPSAVIAGALFDIMGWLTSRKERIVLSYADEASPAIDAIRDFAKMRGLSLDDARVQDWNTTPPQRHWVGLTDEEVYRIAFELEGERWKKIAEAIEAKLKDKNT